MEIREVMTESVVTAAADTAVRRVAEIMRERNVGSVVLLGGRRRPVGFITDRDLAVSVLADGHGGDASARPRLLARRHRRPRDGRSRRPRS